MKICVTSQGRTVDSSVDSRFGRAAFFLIVDLDTMDVKAIDNANVDASSGAGVNSAQIVIDSGAEVLLTGNCGPKAMTALQAGSVKVYTSTEGTVAKAIEDFKNGKLS